jgi:electron transport complex protein RnfD
MADVIIAMMPLYAMSVYFFGLRPLYLGAFSMMIAVIAGIFCSLLGNTIPNIRDQSNLVTGMLIPLLLPASVRLEIVAAATIFALVVVKYPFGGVGQNVFNPAAGGFAFAALCWPREVFRFPIPFEKLSVQITENVRIGDSIAHVLSIDSTPSVDYLDLLLGNVPGSMGATHILVLATCFLFLKVRKIAYASTTLSCLATAFAISFLFPILPAAPWHSASYEMMSGHFVFASIFLINDPVTSPKRLIPRSLYGCMVGALSIMFRRIGNFEDSTVFALLLLNAVVWNLDLLGEYIARYSRRHRIDKQTES